MARCTIAIPVYNRATMVHQAVASALSQSVTDLEILVVDNCSTDGTWDQLQQYDDPRLRLVRNDRNVGLFGNFNRCLDLAQGTYLRFLCSDDLLPDDCLAREIEIMDRHPGIALLSTRGLRVNATGQPLGQQADHFQPGIYPGLQAIQAVLWFNAHYAYNPLNYPSGILLRREAVTRAGQFNTQMRMCGDVDLFLRVLEHGDLAVIDTIGCHITVHQTQESELLNGDVATIREMYLLTERYATLLQQAGWHRRVQRQLSAYALGLAYKHWRQGRPEAARAHLSVAHDGTIGWPASLMAASRLVLLRMLMKTTGKRLIPVQPIPLSLAAPGQDRFATVIGGRP